MNIIQKISILFIVSLLLMSTIGLWIDEINTQRVNNLVKDKYLGISNNILENINDKEKIESLIEKYELRKINNIEKTTNEIYYNKFTFGFIRISQESFDNELVLEIKYLNDKYILKTNSEKNINDKRILNILVFLDIFLLIIIFLYIIKLVYPLRKITKNIDNFSKGNYSTRIDIKTEDEIGKLSKTFNNMAYNLQELINTRENLLRDIGHELRTPIAKGKFAIEKLEKEDERKLLQKIFHNLETLTNELIELEKLNSTKLDKSYISIETLILESLSKLYIEDENKIKIDIKKDFYLNVDLYYYTIALKNLFDNALKYATSYPIVIQANPDKIVIKNKGNKLKNKLEHYLKPFIQEKNTNNGFGLGLSIIYKILNKHNHKLKYTYENNYNIFIIDLNKL